MSYNPFEEKRRNEMIARLVKETEIYRRQNKELDEQVVSLTRERDLLKTACSYLEKLQPKWIPVSEVIPPFDTLILLRGVIDWRSEDSVSYFSDEVQNDYEILEYGRSGYLLKNNSDYLVVNCPDPSEVCSEYITHWMPLPEEPKS